MIVNREIHKFLKVVAAGWNALIEDEHGYDKDELECDWLQFHWELLIEQKLHNKGHDLHLDTYGSGAETHNGRIFPAKGVFCQVLCAPKSGKILKDFLSGKIIKNSDSGFLVQYFVAAENGYHTNQAPFNCVAIFGTNEEETLYLDINDLDFYVKEFQVDKAD